MDKNIKYDQIFFSDETKIDLSPLLNDSIRLSKINKEKLKEENTGAFELINRPKKNLKNQLA